MSIPIDHQLPPSIVMIGPRFPQPPIIFAEYASKEICWNASRIIVPVGEVVLCLTHEEVRKLYPELRL